MSILSYAEAELLMQNQAMMQNLTLQDFWFDQSHHHLMLKTTFGSLSKIFPHMWHRSTITILEKQTFVQEVCWAHVLLFSFEVTFL